MGKKKVEENPKPSEQKEGHNLLGAPKFKKLENGRYKCVQTGHELPAHAKEAYAESKHCRLGLINSALARSKPPLNMFEQDPASRSKLICKLTGDTINKTEEHIWKHINGKRFLNMLEKTEAEKETENGEMEIVAQDEDKDEMEIVPQDEDKKKTKKKKNGDGSLKKKKKLEEEEENVDEIINEVRDSTGKNSDSENEDDFWMPPEGERWDHDDGGDRWGSDSESGSENDDAGEEDMGAEAVGTAHETGELSKQTKRMSIEIGPSSFASRKKKKKISAA